MMDHDNHPLLTTLLKRLDTIEKTLKEVSMKPSVYHIQIEELNIHDSNLKELSFQLKSLDIHELSGSLNIGNNFGSAINRQKSQTSKKNKTNKEKSKFEKEIEVKVNNQPIPFTVEKEGENIS